MNEQSKVLGFEVGADDYIDKPFSFQVLGLKIKALMKRSYDLAEDRQLLTYGNITLDVSSKTVYKNDEPVQITGKEFELLEYMMRHPETVLKKEKLFDEIWGVDCFSDLGSIAKGKLADIAVFDSSFNATEVFVGGKIVYRKN